MIAADLAWRWTWKDFGAELLVPVSAGDILRGNRQPQGGVERGGLLFADASDSRGLILSRVSPPSPADKAHRHSIALNKERCVREIEEANRDGLRLIGFWHSHPEDVPDLSPVDITSFMAFSEKNRVDMPWPVAVIVGRDVGENGIRAWSIRPTKIYLAETTFSPSG